MGFVMKYQPNQELSDYEISDLVTSSVITGDFTTDSLKYGFGPTALRAEDDYDATYGKAQAKIRRRLKKKIMGQSIMGTAAGEWSARKSQELKRQYEAACEKAGLKPYKGSKTKSQDNLSNWSKQNWRTASGKKSSKTGEPYFPAKAVAELKQKNLYSKAIRQKKAATQAGKQHARYSDDIRAVVKKYRSEDEEIDKILELASKRYKKQEKSIKKSISLRRRNKITQQIIEILSKSEEPLTTPEITELIPENLWPKTYRSKKLLHRLAYNKYIPVSYFCQQLVREGTLIKAKGEQTLSSGKTIPINTYQLKDAEMRVLAAEPWDSGERFSLTPRDLEREIADGLHTNSSGDLGCPVCGNIDYFWKTTTSKGTKYRCMMCEYTDDYETVKSQGDITLQKFGLTVECPICKESISAYNQDSINRHLKKHEKESAEPKVSEAENPDLTGYFYKGRPIKPKDNKKAEDSDADDYALVVGDLSDTEQLSLEIEDIDETYGLLNLSEIETSVQEFAINAASEMMEDYSDIMPCIAIVFVSDSFSAHHVARYRGQTVGNCPIVMLSLTAIKDSAAEYDVPLNLAVATSVWHELGHALDEYCLDYLNFDVVSDDDPEEFAESFARWYSGFSNLAPPSQEQLFELSED